MTLLFDLHLTKTDGRAPRGFGRPCVGATFEGISPAPDAAAVRACLPSQWRKAFDRATFWQVGTPGAPESYYHSMTLYDVRRRALCVLHATPREFNC